MRFGIMKYTRYRGVTEPRSFQNLPPNEDNVKPPWGLMLEQ